MTSPLRSLCALMATAALVPGSAHAAWPKTLEVEICWNYICNGTWAEWTLFQDGTVEDQYGSTGEFFHVSQFPTWPYGDDMYLFYDNGETTYWGNAPEPVAITEFINDPNGQEWVELYNFSNSTENLQGYTLRVGTTNVTLGNISIPGKSYVVLTPSPTTFVNEWGVGTAGTDVRQAALPALPDGGGSLALVDPTGAVAWQLTWIDDDDPGFSTVLTQLDMRHIEHPSVDRTGTDDPDGYVGYESYSVYRDRHVFTSANGDAGSPLGGPRAKARPLFSGEMITYHFPPYYPYYMLGMWCEGGC